MDYAPTDIGGTFVLIHGSTATQEIACDASADDLESALETLPSVKAVSVSREVNGLDHGFTWSVTFFVRLVPQLRSAPTGGQ